MKGVMITLMIAASLMAISSAARLILTILQLAA
jgi:hypothetical protein